MLGAKVRTLLRVAYCEKFFKNFHDPPVQCADWSTYSSKVEWLKQAIPMLQGRVWWWVDDDVRTYAKEIQEANLPEEQCIQVSGRGVEALEELRSCLQR